MENNGQDITKSGPNMQISNNIWTDLKNNNYIKDF